MSDRLFTIEFHVTLVPGVASIKEAEDIGENLKDLIYNEVDDDGYPINDVTYQVSEISE